MTETTLVASLLHELSVELGFELTLEREFGYAGRIQTKYGKVYYFRGTHFDINPLGASEIATDKAYASYFMNKLGFPTPEGKSFYSDRWCKKIKSDQDTSAALRYARTLQYPVIVKPNSKSQGQGVVKAFTDDELTDALDYIFNTIGDPVALVQRVVQGSDYRIVVLGTEVLCAYRRTPLSVQGDGGSTIQQLLRKKQEAFIQKGRDTTIYVGDPRTKNILKRMGLSLKSVIAEGNAIQLLDNANLSSGGEGDDVTHILHSDY
ncbi:cyanophycin synthetase, partial [Candidatus Woesebacteria bacterium]|nr:cyanophycin synthetase [Candidatus Woesebacteria bacterium]